MAGSPPPPDGNPPNQQAIIDGSASFEAGPPAASLCGFALPTFRFAFSLKLPALPIPPPIPFFSFSLSLNCDLSNPLNVSAGLNWGGGRVATFDPDPDDVAIKQYENG